MPSQFSGSGWQRRYSGACAGDNAIFSCREYLDIAQTLICGIGVVRILPKSASVYIVKIAYDPISYIYPLVVVMKRIVLLNSYKEDTLRAENKCEMRRHNSGVAQRE